MDPSEANIRRLCKLAFGDPGESSAALKSIANILLLHKESRQIFVDTKYVGDVADRLQVDGDSREDEMICSRLLFLLTYDTNFDFNALFDEHALAESIHHNISFHASKYSGRDLRNDKSRSTDDRALTESLKLLFNLTQFYPERIPRFTQTVSSVLTILSQIPLPNPTLQPPITPLINVLLNLDLDEVQTDHEDRSASLMFPQTSRDRHTRRFISILEAGLQSEKNVDALESLATPLISLLRRVNAIAPPEVRSIMQAKLLPSKDDRSKPLGKSDNLASRLLRLSTSPSGANLIEATSSLLFELSDKDAITFIRNVGYGYAAGFLMTHKISVPERVFEDGGAEATHVDGQEVNPITGQRRDMEPVDQGPEMTDEEKEREAEKLFVLFERLKATGVVNVMNPVEQAQREGKIEEVD